MSLPLCRSRSPLFKELLSSSKRKRFLDYPVFRLLLRLRCAIHDQFLNHGELPLPPALLRYRVSESLSIPTFLLIGERCAQLITTHLGPQLLPGSGVRDFGCGCGRSLRWLLPAYPDVGLDVDPEAIAWCRGTTLPRASRSLPPRKFDAIYCISVFTHLNEAAQDRYLAMLHGLLKPNGVLLFTVHGDNAAKSLRPQQHEDLISSGFLHLTSTKLRGIVPPNYHTTWHTEPYLAARLAPHFPRVEYHVILDGVQDVVLAYMSTHS